MISIDVGSKKVCVIEGFSKKGSNYVSSYGEISYEDEVVVNGNINDRAALGFLINEIIKRKNMKSKEAIVTINSSDIVVRYLKLPNVKVANLKLLVNSEFSRLIKEDNNYIIDFVIKNKTEDNMLNVMACAVPKGLVESYFSLLKELKLKPFAFDINQNSIAKLLSDTTINDSSQANANIIVADLGYSNISYYGFSNGSLSFNRTDISPVQEFVRELGSINRIDVTDDYINSLDLSPGYDNDDPLINDTCKYFVYKLGEEIQKYIQYLIINSEIKSVEKIYIFGGIALSKGITTALSQSIKLPVELLKSCGNVKVADEICLSKVVNAAGALIRQ